MPDIIKDDIGDPSLIGQVHALYKAVTGIKIERSAMTTERRPRPFMVYDIPDEAQYKRFQIMKHYSVSAYNLPIIEYKNPHKFDFQYTIVHDSQDQTYRDTSKKLNRYLVQDNFKLAMDRLGIGFHVLSDITEASFKIDGFSDRQFIFRMRYTWADIWTDQTDTAGAGFIDTINEAQVAPPAGA